MLKLPMLVLTIQAIFGTDIRDEFDVSIMDRLASDEVVGATIQEDLEAEVTRD